MPTEPVEGMFEWLMEAGFVLKELPRYYTERLGFRTWDEVTAHVQASELRPRWWDDEERREQAQRIFARLIAELPPDDSP